MYSTYVKIMFSNVSNLHGFPSYMSNSLIQVTVISDKKCVREFMNFIMEELCVT